MACDMNCPGCSYKRCLHSEMEPCTKCGVLISMSNARSWDVGEECFGCIGRPYCTCDQPHKGDCGATPPA